MTYKVHKHQFSQSTHFALLWTPLILFLLQLWFMARFKANYCNGLLGPFAPGMLKLPCPSSQKFLCSIVKSLTSEAYRSYRCIVSDSICAAKQLILLYSGKLGCRTVLVHGLHPTLTHGSKKSHEHYHNHAPVNGINLSIKLCEGIWKGFLI